MCQHLQAVQAVNGGVSGEFEDSGKSARSHPGGLQPVHLEDGDGGNGDSENDVTGHEVCVGVEDDDVGKEDSLRKI